MKYHDIFDLWRILFSHPPKKKFFLLTASLSIDLFYPQHHNYFVFLGARDRLLQTQIKNEHIQSFVVVVPFWARNFVF